MFWSVGQKFKMPPGGLQRRCSCMNWQGHTKGWQWRPGRRGVTCSLPHRARFPQRDTYLRYRCAALSCKQVGGASQSTPRRFSQLVQWGKQARGSRRGLLRSSSSMYWHGHSACDRWRGEAGLPPSSSSVQSKRWRRKSLPQRCRYRRNACSANPCICKPPTTSIRFSTYQSLFHHFIIDSITIL